jgi:hypothetical protein
MITQVARLAHVAHRPVFPPYAAWSSRRFATRAPVDRQMAGIHRQSERRSIARWLASIASQRAICRHGASGASPQFATVIAKWPSFGRHIALVDRQTPP